MPKLTVKQERYAQNLFAGMYQRDAYIDAYRCKYALPTIDANASRLAKNAKVLQRLDELRDKAESAKIMTVVERKERLSEIARARLTDYQEAGIDGSGYISIGKESPNTAAIAGIESATKFDENGNTGTLFTKIRLHNPIDAIQELNKMERIYTDSPTVNIDNRKLEINVTSENARKLLTEIVEGVTPHEHDKDI